MTSALTNLIQKTIGAKRCHTRSTSPNEEEKKYNPTVLMKNESMKEHFKKKARQNFFENLVGDQNLNSGKEEEAIDPI